MVEKADLYAPTKTGCMDSDAMPDFDLRIKYQSAAMLLAGQAPETVAQSISPTGVIGDNIEHLHVPVPFDGLAGDYFIEVELFKDGNGQAKEYDYGLAWWAA